MSDPITATGSRPTYLIFYVEGFDKREKETDDYKNVKKFEVIARSAREAIHKAKQLLKCDDYKVWTVSERYYDNT